MDCRVFLPAPGTVEVLLTAAAIRLDPNQVSLAQGFGSFSMPIGLVYCHYTVRSLELTLQV